MKEQPEQSMRWRDEGGFGISITRKAFLMYESAILMTVFRKMILDVLSRRNKNNKLYVNPHIVNNMLKA